MPTSTPAPPPLFDTLEDAQHLLAHSSMQHHLPTAHPSEAALNVARSRDWSARLAGAQHALEALGVLSLARVAQDSLALRSEDTLLAQQGLSFSNGQNWDAFSALFSPQSTLSALTQMPADRRLKVSSMWAGAFLECFRDHDAPRLSSEILQLRLHPHNAQAALAMTTALVADPGAATIVETEADSHSEVDSASEDDSTPEESLFDSDPENDPLANAQHRAFLGQSRADQALVGWRLSVEWAATHCAALGMADSGVASFPGVDPVIFAQMVNDIAQAPWFKNAQAILSPMDFQDASESFFGTQWAFALGTTLHSIHLMDSPEFTINDHEADCMVAFESFSSATRKAPAALTFAREQHWLDFQQRLLSSRSRLPDLDRHSAATSPAPGRTGDSSSAFEPLALVVWDLVQRTATLTKQRANGVFELTDFAGIAGSPFRLLQGGLASFPHFTAPLIAIAQAQMQEQTSKDWTMRALVQAKLNGVPSDKVVHGAHVLLASLPAPERTASLSSDVARAAFALSPKHLQPGYHRDGFIEWARLANVLDTQAFRMAPDALVSTPESTQSLSQNAKQASVPQHLAGMHSCVRLALRQPLETPQQAQAVLMSAGVALLRDADLQSPITDLLSHSRGALEAAFAPPVGKKAPLSAAAAFAASLPEQQRFARHWAPTPMVLGVLESLVDRSTPFSTEQANNLVESMVLGHTHPLGVEMAIGLAGPALDLSSSSIISKAVQRLEPNSSHSAKVIKLLMEQGAPLRIDGNTAKRFGDEVFSWTEKRDISKIINPRKGKKSVQHLASIAQESQASRAATDADAASTATQAPPLAPKPRGRRL